MASESLEVVSVEQDGRVLSGVGADADALRETMDRHTPEESPEASAEAKTTPPPTPTEQPEQRKATRGRERYSELTKARDDEKAAREAAERERDELKAKLAAAPARTEPAATSPAAVVPVARPAATLPKEPDFETEYESLVGTKYDSYAKAIQAFNRDYAKWSQVEIDSRIRERIEADREAQRHAAKVDEVISRGRKTYPDFDAVLNAPHMTAMNWPGDKIQVLASLDNPEHIQYQLGKDPALAESLRAEPNLAKFGMRLAQLMTAVPVASLASTGPASFVPPPPMQPVGSGSKTTVPPSAELARKGFDFDKSGYRERRAAERGVFRKVK